MAFIKLALTEWLAEWGEPDTKSCLLPHGEARSYSNKALKLCHPLPKAFFSIKLTIYWLFPYLGHQLGLTDRGFGLWAGSAINDPLKVFPWFILWFLCASLLNTLGFFDNEVIAFTGHVAKFMIVMALTGTGLSSDFRTMLKIGFRPILFGLMAFSVAAISLSVQWVNGQLWIALLLGLRVRQFGAFAENKMLTPRTLVVIQLG